MPTTSGPTRSPTGRTTRSMSPTRSRSRSRSHRSTTPRRSPRAPTRPSTRTRATTTSSAGRPGSSTGPSNESSQAVDFLVSNDNNGAVLRPAGDRLVGQADLLPGGQRGRLRHGHRLASMTTAASPTAASTPAARRRSRSRSPRSTTSRRSPRAPTRPCYEDSGAASISGWATGLSRGPSNESGQTRLLQRQQRQQRAVQRPAGGECRRGPELHAGANLSGSATVTVSIQDDGGTSNGGVDTSATQTFTITVNAGERRPVVHQGRRTRPSTRTPATSDVARLGDRDQHRSVQRVRPVGRLPRQQRQQRRSSSSSRPSTRRAS